MLLCTSRLMRQKVPMQPCWHFLSTNSHCARRLFSWCSPPLEQTRTVHCTLILASIDCRETGAEQRLISGIILHGLTKETTISWTMDNWECLASRWLMLAFESDNSFPLFARANKWKDFRSKGWELKAL